METIPRAIYRKAGKMSRLNYKDGLSFDIYIMDLCEIQKPKTCKDLEELSGDLHERMALGLMFITGDD